MKKRIYVTEEAKKHLAKVFKCSRVSVWNALNFNSDSDQARRIRHVALTQHGGVPSWAPAEMETTHDEVSRTMTQTFGPRVRLVHSKTTGEVTVFVDNKVESRHQVKDIPGFMQLQREVGQLAMSL